MTDRANYLHKVSCALDALCGNLTGKKLCVCLSGGADSVSLLVSLYKLREKYNYILSAAHVNHMLRGKESERDENFCSELCDKLGIQLYITKIDIKALSVTSGKSIEETARDARYSYFKELGEKKNIDYFTTAHTKNDNAETVYMNIIRGTTVSGLCGIPPVNGNVIRPLLKISREENEAFLKENNFSFVTDSTNSDNDITRNYIRNILLPCAKKINPLAIEAADRLSAYARNDEDYFDLILDNISDDVKDSELYPAVLRRKLQREYAEITGGKSLMAVHIDALISLAGNKNGKILSMPDNIEAEVIDGNIKFISKKDSNYPKKLSDSGIYELKFGKNNFADGKIRILCSKINTGTDENIYNNYTQIILDFGKIVGSVRYRQRQAGDRIMCRGVNRSIKKEFNEKHVPPEIRDAVPVFFDDEGIIYVPFVGACDRVYHRGNSKAPVMIDVHFWAGISE